MSDEEDDVKDPQAVIKECDVISAVRIVLRRFVFYSSGF
jgi:hypothetical protein